VLVHGAYLGGVFVAIKAGMAAGTSAMLVGLQPLVTVAACTSVASASACCRVNGPGLVMGLAGVYFVVRHKVELHGRHARPLPCAIALAGISVGTLYQKRPLRARGPAHGRLVQFARVRALFAPLALMFESEPIQWTGSFVFALGWSVIVLSVGAISLLYWLLRHGAAAEVARPLLSRAAGDGADGVPALRRTLDALAIAGMVLIAAGVALARPHGARAGRSKSRAIYSDPVLTIRVPRCDRAGTRGRDR
jgi:drug/metabolite transporter (DMT)-like permease